MDRNELTALATAFTDASELNRVSAKLAIRPDLAGLRMYEPPLMGVAAADDAGFEALRRPGIVGPHFRPPRHWLPEAKSVISLFLPFTDDVVRSNRVDPVWPSPEWLHARIEGQVFQDALCRHIVSSLEAAGHRTVAPHLTPDFIAWRKPPENDPDSLAFTSNWSERHVAFVAGLGTFGLAAGIITAHGTAGRLCSVITALDLPPDVRPYQKYDEYCTYCGACVKKCVHGAVIPGRLKDKALCAQVMGGMKIKYHPRYGCGKCQMAVPCERKKPARATPAG